MTGSRGSVFEQALALADIVDMPSVHALARDLAEIHGVGFQLLDGDGRLVAHAGAAPSSESWGGMRFVREALTWDGTPLGTIVVGPLDAGIPGLPARAQRLALHARTLVMALVHVGVARRYAEALQSDSVLESHREVAELHRRLGEAMERGKDLDRLKANFLATMSHELRTPLTSVIGYSEMLLQGLAGELAGEQRTYVQTIMDKGEQLLGLIGSLIDTARAGSGTMRVRREPVDAGQEIAAVLATVRPVAERRKLRLIAEVAPSLGPVLADRDKLRQVLLNLVGNALKFTAAGGSVAVGALPGRLTERDPNAGPFPAAADAARLWVRDAGTGIAAEHLERIFEPFYQIDGTSTREHGGAGIGLALVRSFVVAMDGRVWAESELGRGSVFNVVLPLAPPVPADPVAGR